MAFDLADVEAQHHARHRGRRRGAHRRPDQPGGPRARAAVPRPRACTSSKTPPTRTAARSAARAPVPSASPAAFSFYPTKVMAGGEGGMIVTDDEAIVEAAHTYRDQGKGSFLANFHTRLGANWRMSEPHAAIVQSQLGRLDEFIAARQALAKRYDAAVDDLGLRPLRIPADAHCNYYKYIAFLPDGIDRAALKQIDARALRRRALGRGLRHSAAPAAGVRGLRRPRAARARSSSARGTSAYRCIRRSARATPTTSWSPSGPRSARWVPSEQRTDRDHGRFRIRRARTSSTRCSAPATTCGSSTRSRRCSRTSSGPTSTCSTRTPSPTR